MERPLYLPEVIFEETSILGRREGVIDLSNTEEPILKAFRDDNDVQEITICSGSVGYIRTYRKQYTSLTSETQ